MRLDKYLFFIRLTKSRTLAQHIIAQGHVRIDGQPAATAHTRIHTGQVITMPLNDRIRIVRVEALPTRRGPAAEAMMCYTDLSPANPRLTAATADSNPALRNNLGEPSQ